jgi:hypothetical protein
MSSAFQTKIRETFAGQMSEGERRICQAIERAVEAALESKVSFRTFAETLWNDLRVFVREHNMDVDAALAAAYKPRIESLATAPAGLNAPALSAAESQFLRDADGLLKFANRNGLSFSLVLSILMHDLSELSRYGWSLERVVKEGFVTPKVDGWAKRNSQPVGEADE